MFENVRRGLGMFEEKKDKGEKRRRKEESVYNPFLYFMSF